MRIAFERGLHVLDGGAFEVRPGSRQGFDEAVADALDRREAYGASRRRAT